MFKAKKKEIIYIVFLFIICCIIAVFSDLKTRVIGEYLTVGKLICELKDSESVEPKYFNIEDTLKLLPKELIEYLYINGVKIKTTDELGEEGEYGTITSNYTHKTRVIMIQSFYSNQDVLLHEIGHAVSYNMLPVIKLSETNKFKHIYNKEKDILFPDGGEIKYPRFNIKNEYIKSSPEEYFAQCFSLYFRGQLPCESASYEFWDGILKKYFQNEGIQNKQ